jgi:predicted nucleic acid-binding Zn ribbon protein
MNRGSSPGAGGGGPGRRRSGRDRGPRPVADSLDAVVGQLGPVDAGSLAAVFNRWEDIAGPRLAGHVRPLRLENGVLVVAADHPARATQVRSLSATLLARVGEITGQAPDRLEVTVRRT